MNDPWELDTLGYKSIGETFTNLVRSIETGNVISIEAGFGRGKTFFRTAWSKHLRQTGLVVIEIDVQQSDHSGDPIITLLGALVDAIPKKEALKRKQAFESAKKLGAIGARTLAKALLKAGADELIDLATESAIDKLDSLDALDDVIGDLAGGMSKAAGQFIAAQMAIEKVRNDEVPKQLKLLKQALIKDANSDRVVIIIDELDRCHPDYAIAVLEALKLVFNQSGFVFCLMVNSDYLENLAQHRFGVSRNDEKYLDKFVDLRLSLAPKEDSLKNAVRGIALGLHLAIAYGDSEEFSLEHAAELAGDLAVYTKQSMRKTKRILLKVKMALLCYADRPLDASLLVFLAFQDVVVDTLPSSFLPRSFLTPEVGNKHFRRYVSACNDSIEDTNKILRQTNDLIQKNAPEFLKLPRDRYDRDPKGQSDQTPLILIFQKLAPHYLTSHRDALDAVASIIVLDS